MMVRWTCGMSLRDGKCTGDLYSLLNVQKADVLMPGRLSWFGHPAPVRRDLK